MNRLSAFGDEISPDLDEQLDVLQSEGIAWLELRAAWGTNVLDLTDAQIEEIRQALERRQMGVSAIGSPIGKVSLDADFGEHLRRLDRALVLAEAFRTPFIRIFSFYAPSADPGRWPVHRDAVLLRLSEMTARARAGGRTLLHENERDIYGDTIERCADLLSSIGDPHFQAVFDPANFIQCDQTPYPEAYEALRPWIRYVHVKDARPDGAVVAAGEGVARWPDLLERLRQDGYSGFFSLEPHLASAGRLSGFSGPERFRHASRAFQALATAVF